MLGRRGQANDGGRLAQPIALHLRGLWVEGVEPAIQWEYDDIVVQCEFIEHYPLQGHNCGFSTWFFTGFFDGMNIFDSYKV